MIGAIIGDIVGSTYEFKNTQNYDFKLFPASSSFTDDTICTIAVADAILKEIPYRESILKWCKKYPHPMGGYGISFAQWLHSDNPQPYDSFGNGAAMRVSPIGYAFTKRDDVMNEAKKSAECSHSHDEGIKGASVIALAVYYLSTYHWKEGKQAVSQICEHYYGSDYAEHLPLAGQWNETCQGCVPLAIHIFLQSENFEDAIRKAISYGGDSDTLGAIVGSLAGAYYEIPTKMQNKALRYLPDDMKEVFKQFTKRYGK